MSASQPVRTGRAAPLPPEERRRAIVAALVPLLLEHGGEVSTRQVAEAAGVAEGTLFRVFPDKPSLLMAAAEEVLNPADAGEQQAEALAGLESLRDKVLVTAERMVARAERSTVVLMALRRAWMARPPGAGHGTEHEAGHNTGPQAVFKRSGEALHRMLTEVFTPHADELSVEPETAAVLMRTLVLGSRHPGADDAARLSPAQITDALLDGVLIREEG